VRPKQDVRRKRGIYGAGCRSKQPLRSKVPDDPGVVRAVRETKQVRYGAREGDRGRRPEGGLLPSVRIVGGERRARCAQGPKDRAADEQANAVREPCRDVPHPGCRPGGGEEGRERRDEQGNVQAAVSDSRNAGEDSPHALEFRADRRSSLVEERFADQIEITLAGRRNRTRWPSTAPGSDETISRRAQGAHEATVPDGVASVEPERTVL